MKNVFHLKFNSCWVPQSQVRHFVHVFCILCMRLRFRYFSLYILMHIDTPDDDCGYSVVLERSSV